MDNYKIIINMKKIKIIHIVFFLIFSLLSKAQSQKIDDLHNRIGQRLDGYREQSKLTNNENVLSDEYKQAYEKLKELYIKKQESESVKKSNELQLAFTKKMNITDQGTLFDLRGYGDMLEWIRDNITSTSFQNIEEATKEYEKYLEISSQVYKENEEFYTYMIIAVNKFGGKIFGDVALDYEINHQNSTINKLLDSQH